MKLETKIRLLIPEKENTTYSIRAFELWRDDCGWSVNDSWQMGSNLTYSELLEYCRGRWEVFKLNYFPKCRVSDIQILDSWSEEPIYQVEIEFMSLFDIEEFTPNQTRK